MKTSHLNKLTRITGLAVGAAFMLAIASQVKSEEPIFKGGAQKLMSAPSATTLPSAKAMACPKCVTVFVNSAAVEMKASAPKTQLVARHLCKTCETTITTVGHGKGKHDVATHKCDSCGGEKIACCTTK